MRMEVAFKSLAKVNETSISGKAEPTSMSERPVLKWGDTQPANSRKLQRWPANIKSEHGTEEIDLEAFNPADRGTEIAPE